ncbi:MAG TPA: ATP-binding protein, partial [Vicinamibacterales bacterium]
DLRVESRRDSIVVWGDSSRLQQVLMNLLTNASKFTPPGGSIDVRLESAGHEARLLVEDSGIGIEPHLLPHVFEPFRKGKDSSTGLGLGLAIVTHIVEMHGGRVTAASAGRGCGTSITLALPLMAAAERGGRRTEA